jgi:hypothetical protein
MQRQFIILFSLSIFFSTVLHAQDKKIIPATDDTIAKPAAAPEKKLNRYDSAMQAHSPKKAAIKSALVPGLGQIYNKKYWKLPIVYGALGTCGAVFAYNLTWYKRTKYAYNVLFKKDSANFNNINPKLQIFVAAQDLERLRYYRNQYRRDIDYSVLFFIALWGLNVVDATVDAHLKSFDVSPDLSLKIKPGYSELAQTHGLTIALKIGK